MTMVYRPHLTVTLCDHTRRWVKIIIIRGGFLCHTMDYPLISYIRVPSWMGADFESGSQRKFSTPWTDISCPL